MNTPSVTADLVSLCPRMPQNPGIGLHYMQDLYPVPAHKDPGLRDAARRYYGWMAGTGPEPDQQDFDLVKQYLIYHIHAPIWLENPHTDGWEIVPLRQRAIALSSWKEINLYLADLFEMGMDPI